ncbi:unnamed protein product [Trifolium pratense]|uniref:Uncharacterized protein n=1 Tax=Trifolium pratense TaxID=57577 RepID=A0ACB0K7Y3_TRIPR|nr:unnamed protein product [Trifolium pratense]
MATYNNGQFPANLPILDGKNYDSWSKQMKVLFNYQDVMDQVTNGVDSLTEGATENQRTQHKELKKKDFKALFIIHQSVPFFTTTHIFFSCHHEHNRVDFPYSANKTEDPRSQDRTDKTEVAELIRLERSFSPLVEELTSKRESLQLSKRSSERKPTRSRVYKKEQFSMPASRKIKKKQVKQEKVGIMKRFSLRIAEFKRKKNEEKREDEEKDKKDNKKPQDAEIIIISSDSEAEENEDDADYVEFLASYVPEEEQEEEEQEQNPDPIEISSEDAEEKSEISSEFYPSD